MAFEKECDDLLSTLRELLNDGKFGTHGITYEELNRNVKDKNISDNLKDVFTILVFQDYVVMNKNYSIEKNENHYIISDKGISFSYTDSFVERKERWDLEKRIKIQQSKLNRIELILKPYTFYIAVLGVLISIIALYISLHGHS